MGRTLAVAGSAAVRRAGPGRPRRVGGLFLTSIQSVRTWATNVTADGSGIRGATRVLAAGACDVGERCAVEQADITARHAPTTASHVLLRPLGS